MMVRDFSKDYKEKGAYHHKLSGFKEWFLVENYRRLAGFVEEGDSVLDLGCGDGRFCQHCLNAGAERYVGVDSSNDAIKLARKIYVGSSEVSFAAGSILNLSSFSHNGYDKFISSLTLFYFSKSELAKIFKEFRSISHPNSLFVASYRNLTDKVKFSDDNVDVLPRSELLRILGKSGLELVHLSSITRLLPSDVVDGSTNPSQMDVARAEFERACDPFCPIDDSYHYIFAARPKR